VITPPNDKEQQPPEPETPEEEEETPSERQIFRKASLERLANPEQLDSLLVVLDSKSWVVLYTILALLAAIILWSFLGRIPIKVEGRGIVMSKQGLFSVQTKAGGTVINLLVKPGDVVPEGKLIAEIYDPEENLKLKDAEIKVANLTRHLANLKEEIQTEEKAEKEGLRSEIAAKQFAIEQINGEISTFEVDLAKKKELAKEGLLSVNTVRDAEEKLVQKHIELETTKANLETLRSQLAKSYRTEEYKQREQELFKEIETRDLLATKLKYSQIYSPAESRVLETLVNVGDLVTPGTPIVWMELISKSKLQVVYGYFPVEQGKRIVVGDVMEMDVSTVELQEYGYLLGKVNNVSHYAVSRETIAKTIHNKGLVDYLMGGSNAVVQVIVEPELDPKTYSGYRWTSEKGPPIRISTGTVCKMKAIVEHVRPIYYIIPLQSLKLDE
jgi:HlyD family secretion protein